MQHESILSLARPAPAYSIPVFSQSFGSWRLSVDRSPFEPEALAGHYDQMSEDWHNIIDRHGFASAYADMIARVMRHPLYRQDQPSLRVLDAGVGTGAMSLAFREKVDAHLHLDAVDISQGMLQQAKARLEHPNTTLNLGQFDLVALPYQDNTFDVILAAHVIEHLPDPQIALAELCRVLKPGGILICSITRASFVGALVQLMWRTHRVSRSVALGWLRGCGLQSVRDFSFGKTTAAHRFSLAYAGRKPHFGDVSA
ncbi:MAG: methyltransferase domain-containing protein [Boseongicola sp.]|nr:methyltransferase domain-containing protein [Boseongicola sp.]MDD9978943.1 methyltransferase domain-containing protein [Boseongicola sp.]